MEREELIQAMFACGEDWSCPGYEMCENVSSCEECAEKQFAEYEKQIRADVIDEIIQKVEFEEKWLFNCYRENGCKYSDKDIDIVFNEIIIHLLALRGFND